MNICMIDTRRNYRHIMILLYKVCIQYGWMDGYIWTNTWCILSTIILYLCLRFAVIILFLPLPYSFTTVYFMCTLGQQLGFIMKKLKIKFLNYTSGTTFLNFDFQHKLFFDNFLFLNLFFYSKYFFNGFRLCTCD